MLSIDEAQTMLNAKAKCIERICKGIYEDCNEQKCDNCDLCYAQGTNGEQIELMLQCADWLEELKVYQQHEIICNKGYNSGYNKAIDDFVKAGTENIMYKTFGLRGCDIEQIAEQLKGRR